MESLMERYNWDQVSKEEMNPYLTRQVIHTPMMTILQVTFKKGAIVPLHRHVHEQVTMLTSGSLLFELDGEEFTLRAGDVLRVPSDVPHMVEAVEDSTGIDLFTPAREDWIK
jgi:quercetin dioxygenase-like cupin family protein